MITIIAMGQLRETWLREAVSEYEKRLSAYTKLKTIELEPPRDELTTSASAAKKFMAAIPPRAYKIALCVEGKEISSEELASRLAGVLSGTEGPADGIAFIIGGADGLPEEIKASCRWRLSFSRMTFPHQLMRVILLEQLYRAFNINANGKYHKV